jgi:hypothetical protein
MAGFLDRYNTSRDLEEEGVWVDFGDGVKVQVRRLNSKHSRETRRKLEKPYSSQFRNREMPDSLQEQLLNKQVAQSIVVNWEGVPNPESPKDQLGYTPDNVLMVIEKFPDFRDDILTASMERTTFEKEQRKEAEKNLKSASSGS